MKMKSNVSQSIITAGICVLFVLAGMPAEATTLIEPVLMASQSNVVFTDIGGGNVQITFAGVFDFSAIGGNLEVYSGTFSYDTSVPPFATPPDPNIDIAFYELNVVNFNIFGSAVTPTFVNILIQDGAGIFNDFFTLQVSFFSGSGLPIPNTSQGLTAIGLNAGAFPGTMFSSIAFPTNLDIFASAIGAGAPTQFAEVSASPVPEPSTQIQGEEKTWVYPKETGKQKNPELILTAVGSPPGGSFTWEIVQGTDIVKIVEVSTDGTNATLKGLRPSNNPQDVKVKVTYSVNSQDVLDTHSVTVVRPRYLCSCNMTVQPIMCGLLPADEDKGVTITQNDDPNLAHRFETTYTYIIADQFGSPIVTDDFNAPPLVASEVLKKFKSNYSAGDGCPISPHTIKTQANVSNGILQDVFSRDCVFLPSNPPDIVTTAEQKIKVNSWIVSLRDITYFFDHAISQETNPKNICLVSITLSSSP